MAATAPDVSTSLGDAFTSKRANVEYNPDVDELCDYLGNKLLLGSVNANREHFEMGIRDLALGEMMFPGVIQKILTNAVDGLDHYQEMMRLLTQEKTALKVFVSVASE